MSEFSSLSGTHDSASAAMPHEMHRDRFARRHWVAPALASHSTLTELTQVPLRQPLSLLFFQASVQCFNHNGNPVPCP